MRKILFLFLPLSACSVFYTKADLEKRKEAETSAQILEPTLQKIELQAKGDAQTFLFEKGDLRKLTNAYVDVLRKEGYQITYQDLYSGKVGAELVTKGHIASFNSAFVGTGNYQVSENTVVEVQLSPLASDILSEMKIKKIAVYSMGQEEATLLKDVKQYKELVAKVQLAL